MNDERMTEKDLDVFIDTIRTLGDTDGGGMTDERVNRYRMCRSDWTHVYDDARSLILDLDAQITQLRERAEKAEATASEYAKYIDRLNDENKTLRRFNESRLDLIDENARLREALEKIESDPTDYRVGSDENMERVREIARAALNPKEASDE